MGEVGTRLWQKERLKKRKEFLRVYNRGAKVKTKLFFIYLLENNLSYSRMGITVSRKVGKPIVRNRLKRRLREVFRKNKSLVNPPQDMVINTSMVTASAPLARLEEEFRRVFLEVIGERRECGE